MDAILEQPQSLCEYSGKVILIVNTASWCGYTPQYEGLEALYRKYKARGLVVLGFGEEPGKNNEIAAFCVNQSGLAKTAGTAPRWNFHNTLSTEAAATS